MRFCKRQKIDVIIAPDSVIRTLGSMQELCAAGENEYLEIKKQSMNIAAVVAKHACKASVPHKLPREYEWGIESGGRLSLRTPMRGGFMGRDLTQSYCPEEEILKFASDIKEGWLDEVVSCLRIVSQNRQDALGAFKIPLPF